MKLIKTTLIIISLIIVGKTHSQSCLPSGIEFVSQTAIDQFSTFFPNCENIEGNVSIRGSNIFNLDGLSHIKQVKGNMSIGGTSIITMHGLNQLDSIHGDLRVYGNNLLETISGFHQLRYIGGSLRFESAYNSDQHIGLISGYNMLNHIRGDLVIEESIIDQMSGFDNLESIGGNLFFKDWTNPEIVTDNLQLFPELKEIAGSIKINVSGQLTGILGFESLERVGGRIDLYNGPNLQSLAGFGNLDSIGGTLRITNLGLQNFQGLHSLSYIGGLHVQAGTYRSASSGFIDFSGLEKISIIHGHLLIEHNNSLESLNGLHNLRQVRGDFFLRNNAILNNISGLNKLTTVHGNLNISNNDSLSQLHGLDNLLGIGAYLHIASNPSLSSPVFLNNLQIVGGSITIRDNNSLSELNGLSSLVTLGSNLRIESNTQLSQINAFTNLGHIGGYLWLMNLGSLQYLNGFQSLETIVGSLEIHNCPKLLALAGMNNLCIIGGDLILRNNSRLENLDGLENLMRVERNLQIENNELLSSLYGMKKVRMASDGSSSIQITHNPDLSVCEISGICHYIKNFPEKVNIRFNLPGCSNLEDILYDCYLSSTPETDTYIRPIIYPNPANDHIYIDAAGSHNPVNVIVFDLFGKEIRKWERITNQLLFLELPEGLYIIEIKGADKTLREKLVVAKSS